MDSLYIVMPAYNEEANIKEVVETWYPVLAGKDKKSKIIIADSGSTDKTHALLEELKESLPNIEILSETDRQHGPKLIALYDCAVKNEIDYVFQTDSDGQTNPAEFELFWNLRNQYDVILGDRQKREDGKVRAFVELIVCFLLKLFFGVNVPDANAPFRLMKTDIVKKYLYKMPKTYNLPNIMMTTYFVYYNERVRFMPISFMARKKGKNSVNMPKIIKIGMNALADFWTFKKEMTGKKSIWGKTMCGLIFLAIAVFIFLTKSSQHIWVGSDSDIDSSVFMTVAMMMDRGYMPYRDTFDHKGPLLYLVNFWGRHIDVYRGIWFLEFISIFITFLFIYKIARLKCGKVLSCVALFLSVSLLFNFFQGGNSTEEYAMAFIAPALFIFLDYFINRKISETRLVLCGLCMGGVCLLRPNMISAWIVFCIAVLVKCIQDKAAADIKRFISFFTIGLFIIMFPVMLWLVANGSFTVFLNDYIKFNFIYAFSDGVSWWDAFIRFFTERIVIISIIATVCLYFTDNRFLYGTYFCYMIFSLIIISISRSAINHYGLVLVPAVAFPLASLLYICKEKFSVVTGKMISFFLIIYFVRILIIPIWIPFISGLPEVYNLRKEDNHSALVKEVCNVVSHNTRNDDKISVYGNWDIIYILSDRVHATKYSYQFPIGQIRLEIMQDYYDELGEQLPKIIVIQAGYYDDQIGRFLNNNNYSLVWEESENEGENARVYMHEN